MSLIMINSGQESQKKQNKLRRHYQHIQEILLKINMERIVKQA